jgi:hypothetical protein
MNKSHYYAYKSQMRDKSSYCLLPISSEAVYKEGLYYPEHKLLLLLSEDTKEKFQLVSKMNDYGEEMFGNNKGRNMPKKDRMKLDTNYEYYLTEQDAKWFIENHVVNAEDFLAFINTPEDIQPIEDIKIVPQEESKIIIE